MKTAYSIFLVTLVLLFAVKAHSQESVVKFNETYELANIILSLTEYGKTDRNEVNKNTAYYQEVLAHFDIYKNHPLISKVNYSRELWDKLLSFRTDAVAFEFDINGNLHRKQIIVSPLVGRMHCQRYFDKKSTSFISIPDYIFTSDKIRDIPEEEIASGIHMFFTETDHDYVNPASDKFRKMLKKSFIPASWDKGSGYENFRNATFNEYMTWAVFDIFARENFPNSADRVTAEWHSINASRGFFASRKFGEKLVELYSKKSENETIIDLYPKLLNWCLEVSANSENTQGKE